MGPRNQEKNDTVVDKISRKTPKSHFLGSFSKVSGKLGFSGKIRLYQDLSFMVPKLHAKNQKNPWSGFPDQFQPDITSIVRGRRL